VSGLRLVTTALRWVGDVIPWDRTCRISAVAAIAVAVSAVPANATDTTVTFTTTTGVLSITSAPSAVLTGGSNIPGGTISGSLGTVTVTDERGTAQGWAASVYSPTGFTATGSPDISVANITYLAGPTTGMIARGAPVVTAGTAGSPGTDRATALTVYRYANTTPGGNSVSWNPTLTVVIPVAARPGSHYSGTISYWIV